MDLIPSSVLASRISIIGAGAIGGWVTLSLAKAGFYNLTVFDHDKVDEVNMNSQFYRFSDIGAFKATALASLVQDFTRVKIDAKVQKYTREDGPLPGIVIAAVDSMSARKSIWETHVERPLRTRLIIDPRMGAETALLYARSPGKKEDQDYAKTLYLDTEAVQERCTAKATIYTANLLAGMVVKTVKDYVVSKEYVRTLTWDISKDDFTAHRVKV
jgi:3-hydroxyacyl-CoA dehydrogenase